MYRQIGYRALCGLVLISMPAASQALRGNCGNPDPDLSIAGCTRKIQSDTTDLKSGGQIQAAASHLATDYDHRGVAYANKRLYDQALADYNQAISLSPKTFPVAYFNRGNAYYEQGLDDQAIADYTMAISLEPNGADPGFLLADAYNYRGNARERKGLYDEAIADFTMAISLKPGLEIAYEHRGNRYLRKALSLDSRNVATYYSRALAYQHKGLYDEAIADLTREISLAPADTGAYDLRGLAYARKGLYDQAIADFTQAIGLNAKDIALHPVFAAQYAGAYGHRGDAYEHKGVIDAAIADYRTALKLDPEMQSAKDALRRLGAGP